MTEEEAIEKRRQSWRERSARYRARKGREFINSKAAETRRADPERARDISRRHRRKHLEEVRKRDREYKARLRKDPDTNAKLVGAMRLWREQHLADYYSKNLIRNMLASAKKRAKERGLQFGLTHEDIIVPDVCPVFGITLEINRGASGDTSPSIDRIIPERGYVKGNVCVISNKANRLKSNMSLEEIEKLADYVRQKTSQSPS